MSGKKFLILIVLAVMIYPFAVYSWDQGQDKDMKKIKKYFKMDLYQLLKTEITTAGKKKEKIGGIPASVVLVTREEIETYGYQNLAEILENIPGVYLIDDYSTVNSGIRGFWSVNTNRNVIILVNGIPYREEVTSAYLLEQIGIPVEAIDRIEVVRGPMSVIYGSGALFGVINIITDHCEPGTPDSIVTASYGSENTQKLFARASGKNGNLQYVLNGSHSRSDGLDVPLGDTGETTGGKLEHSASFFNFSGTFGNLSFKASLSENRKEVMLLRSSFSDGTLRTIKDMRIKAGYKKNLSPTFRLETKMYYFANSVAYAFDWATPDSYAFQDLGSSGFEVELNFFIAPCPGLDITVGIDYLRVTGVFSKFTIPSLDMGLVHDLLAGGEAMITRSIFTQVDYTLSGRLKIVAGAMLEQTPAYTIEQRIIGGNGGNDAFAQATYSHTPVEFIPRLALIYSPNDANIFKFLYGKAINRPSFFHNRDLHEPIIPDNAPLEPETVHTLELNYIAQVSAKFMVSLSVFRNTLDKLIQRTFFESEGSPVSYYANVGEMITNGFEITVMSSLSRKLHFEFSGTYQDTRDRRPGYEEMEAAYSPKLLGYMKAFYFLDENISLALSGNYAGPMETYFDDTLDSPGLLGERTDGYFLLGANLRIRRLLGTGTYLNLRVSNLLGEEVRYPATAMNYEFIGRGTIGRGRSFLLSVGWKF